MADLGRRAPGSIHQRRRGSVLLAAAAIGAIAAAAEPGRAADNNAISIWAGPGGSDSAPVTGNWSDSTAWDSSSGVLPVSGVNTELQFGGSGVSPYTSSNDIGAFTLNTIQLNSSASAVQTIDGSSAGNLLTFASSNQGNDALYPQINQNGSGPFNIAAPIFVSAPSSNTSTSNLTIGGTGLGAVTLSAPMTFGGYGAFNASNNTNVSNAAALVINNPGTTNITGSLAFSVSNSYATVPFSGGMLINAGTVNITGNASVTALAVTTPGGGSVTTNNAPSLGVGGYTGQAVLNINTSGTVLFTTPDIGGLFGPSSVTTNATTKQAAGAVYQSNGTMIFTAGTLVSNYLSIGSGFAATGAVGGYGAYILSGGSLTANNIPGGGGIRVGAVGPGVLLQTGGSITPDRAFLLGTYGAGVATFVGGTFTGAAGSNPSITYIGDTAGTGTLNIGTQAGGNAVFTNQATQVATNGVGFVIGSTASSSGVVNLDSGTIAFTAGGIYKGPGGATLNLNGATIQAAGAGLTLIGSNSTYTLPAKMYRNGITVDTQSYTATISAPLTGMSGSGLYPSNGQISVPGFSGNAGYIAPPLVSITDTTNPSATGATAVANVSNGVITAVIMTSPGTGYASGDNLAFTFTGGESGTASSYYTTTFNYTAGTGDIGANAGGGLLKIGSGILNLTGSNAYTGLTNISAGTLNTSLVASLPGQSTPGAILVQTGATLGLGVGGTGQFNVSSVQNVTANATFQPGSILGLDTTSATSGFNYTGSITGSVGLTKLGSNVLTLSGSNTYTGPTLVSAGTLQINIAGALAGTSGVTVSNGSSMSIADNSGFAGLVGGVSGGAPISTAITGTGVSNNGALRGADSVTATYSGNVSISPFNGSGATSIAGGANGVLILNAGISGNGPLLFAGNNTNGSSSTVVLNAPGTYSGETQIKGAPNISSSTIVQLGVNNALSTGGGLNFPGTGNGGSYLDLHGFNQNVQYLTGTKPGSGSFTGIVNLAPSTVSTLNITSGNGSTFSGNIADNTGTGGTVALALSGGTQTLAGANTYSGGTTISSGSTMTASTTGALGTGPVTMAGGTLALGAVQQSVAISGFNGFSLNNANSSSGFTAPSVSSSTLTLTDNNAQEGTSSYSPLTNINTAMGFVASFTYTPTANKLVGGASFIIQNDPRGQAAVGSPGIGLGYAVDSTNYNSSNAVNASPTLNSAALEINVSSSYVIGVAFDFGGAINKTFTSLSNITLYSGDPINVVLTDNPSAGTITAQLTDSVTHASQAVTYTQTASQNANFFNVLGANSGYIGFGAGVGGSSNPQTITNFTFSNLILAPTAISNAIVAAPNTTSTLQTNVTPGGVVQRVGAMQISSGALLTLNVSSSTPGLRAVLTTPSVSVASASGAFLGSLDIGANNMDISAQPLGSVSALVGSAYANGTWTGPGITSSTAAMDSTHLTALGVIANNQGGTPLYGSGTTLGLFDGADPGASDVLMKYTYYGDTDLNGTVDSADYARIDNAWLNNQSSPATMLSGWYNGDFNYDNVINGSDYTLLDNAFNMQGAQFTAQIADQVAAVPEPTSLALLGLTAITALSRRRRGGMKRSL